MIFVPFSAPGDELLVEVASKRKGVQWGSIEHVITHSSMRVTPFCKHYTKCGGCQLQHIAYTAQLEQKRLILADTLRHLAGLKDIEVNPCIESPENQGYRSQVRLHCKGTKLGFYKTRSNTIIPIESCPMLPDAINACIKSLSAYLASHPIRGLSEIQLSQGERHQVIMTLKMDCLPKPTLVNKLKDTIPATGAVFRTDGQESLLWGQNHSTISIDDLSFRVSSGAFFQANGGLLPTLIKQVLKTIEQEDVSLAVELYSGVGAFSIPLAKIVNKLIAVEWKKRAVADAIYNLSANHIKNTIVYPMSADGGLDLLVSRNIKPDVAVVDPPREGLSTIVCQELKKLSPKQIIYVSCDPATLARDIKQIMSSGIYKLDEVQPVDMFPHTAHIESVSRFLLTN